MSSAFQDCSRTLEKSYLIYKVKFNAENAFEEKKGMHDSTDTEAVDPVGNSLQGN